MQFNLNKLRSWNLRYLVCDPSGQVWAHRELPIRSNVCGTWHWRVADKYLAPNVTVHSTEEEWAAYRAHWRKLALADIHITHPISDCPIDLTWDDEPYDLSKEWEKNGA